jgi:hypothetical protein
MPKQARPVFASHSPSISEHACPSVFLLSLNTFIFNSLNIYTKKNKKLLTALRIRIEQVEKLIGTGTP